MLLRRCSTCAEPYLRARGTECGFCIEAQIEAGVSQLEVAERKPMKRAGAIAEADAGKEVQAFAHHRAAYPRGTEA